MVVSHWKSDDVFPSVLDILGLKSDHFKEKPKPSICPAPGVLTHPRAPLRATTFDGRPLFIPRKPHIMILRKVRNRIPSLSFLTLPVVVFDITNGKPTRRAYP